MWCSWWCSFFLSQEVTGKDKALEQLNAKVAAAERAIVTEKLGKPNLDDQLSQVRAGLASAEANGSRQEPLMTGLAGAGNDAAGRAANSTKALDSEKVISSRALAKIEVLTQQISALRRQLAALEEALDASEKRDKESQGRNRRSRPAPERRAGAAGAGIVALPFGIFRAAAPPFSATGRTSGSSVTALSFSQRFFFDTGQALLLPEGRAELEKLAPR